MCDFPNDAIAFARFNMYVLKVSKVASVLFVCSRVQTLSVSESSLPFIKNMIIVPQCSTGCFRICRVSMHCCVVSISLRNPAADSCFSAGCETNLFIAAFVISELF